ncbi:MAG: tetratricopeptide repeat protein [Clostridia bacterium]|nr:tetratricopeptide repeat protein [Clostridia bacterium]
MKKCIVLMLAVLLFCAGLPVSAFSQNDLNYCIDEEGEKTYTSKTYEQVETINYISGAPVAELSNPEDLFIHSSGDVYVADTGNNRIVRMSKTGEFIREYANEADPFYQPTGVFVDANGDVYVADSGNKRIVVMNGQGEVKTILGKPESDLLSDVNDFTPVKLAVGTTGYIYTIVGKDFMAIDLEGNFKGFVGAERLGFSLKRLLINIFASEEQKARLPKDNPPSYTNFTVNSGGEMTACSGADNGQIKTLNYLGENIYPAGFYGEIVQSEDYGAPQYPVFSDICVDDAGTVTLVEQRGGKVYQYDKEGNSITVFGGIGTTRGYFQSPSAIDRDANGRLYILDRNMNNIQVFAPTEFLNTVEQANHYYFSGDYEASLAEWQKVVKINPDYPLAATRIGKIYYKNEQYDQSLENYFNGDDMTGYSETFGELRHLFLRNHMGVIVVVALVLILALSFGFKKLRKHAKKTLERFYFGE